MLGKINVKKKKRVITTKIRAMFPALTRKQQCDFHVTKRIAFSRVYQPGKKIINKIIIDLKSRKQFIPNTVYGI